MIVDRAVSIVRSLSGPSWFALMVLGCVVLPLTLRVVQVWADEVPSWRTARWDSAGLAPDPKRTPEPVIQFYAARTWGWRGVLGVHSWVAVKRRNATQFQR